MPTASVFNNRVSEMVSLVTNILTPRDSLRKRVARSALTRVDLAEHVVNGALRNIRKTIEAINQGLMESAARGDHPATAIIELNDVSDLSFRMHTGSYNSTLLTASSPAASSAKKLSEIDLYLINDVFSKAGYKLSWTNGTKTFDFT